MEKVPPFHYDCRIQSELNRATYTMEDIRLYLLSKNLYVIRHTPMEIVDKMISYLISIGYMDLS